MLSSYLLPMNMEPNSVAKLLKKIVKQIFNKDFYSKKIDYRLRYSKSLYLCCHVNNENTIYEKDLSDFCSHALTLHGDLVL